jgi:hypothetical protein
VNSLANGGVTLRRFSGHSGACFHTRLAPDATCPLFVLTDKGINGEDHDRYRDAEKQHKNLSLRSDFSSVTYTFSVLLVASWREKNKL